MTYYLTCNTKYEYILRVCTKSTVNIYITNLHEWLVLLLQSVLLNVSTNYSKKTIFCLIERVVKIVVEW